jgi:hypothetical protein
MASNSQTPFLTPEQYKAGYLAYLNGEIKNQDLNWAANVAYRLTGDSEAEEAEAATLAALPRAQLMAETVRYVQLLVIDSEVGWVMKQLTPEQAIYISSNYRLMATTLKSEDNKANGAVFMQTVKNLMGTRAFRREEEIDVEGNEARNIMAESNTPENEQGAGIGIKARGRGSRKYLKGCGMVREGAKPASHDWQSFGNYMIARNDLINGSSVHIRYKNGQRVRALPVKAVGGSVLSVLKSVSDGSAPAYDDISNLTENELEYVNNLMKKSNIAPLGMPTAKKTEKEQDKLKFNKMKGEILAGNDNVQMIKEFKTLLIRMKNRKELPASEVHDILLDLASMGH